MTVSPSRRAIRIALLSQLASLLAYATFLVHLTGGAFVGAFVMTGALVLVLREFAEKVAPFGAGLPLRQALQERAGPDSRWRRPKAAR